MFERSVRDLIAEYLGVLPIVTASHANLKERVRQQHRIGVGQVLTKWSSTNPLYSSIAERDISSGLADGLRGRSYSLLVEAFLLSPENLRVNAIVRLFSDLGFENAFAFVSKSEDMREFVQIRLAGAETAESFLDGFVRIRNEAAHGSGSGLVSANEILKYADFAVLIVESLATLLRSNALRLGLAVGLCVGIGDVVHVYSNNIVGVRASSNETLTVGDVLYGGKKWLEAIEVLSLRVGRVDHASISLNHGFEFGARFDKKIPLDGSILRWKP